MIEMFWNVFFFQEQSFTCDAAYPPEYKNVSEILQAKSTFEGL